MIALKPKVITRSLKNGTAITLSVLPVTGFFISSHLKKINSKNAILQMNVNFDKKFNNLISPEVDL